jgi:hypothetical protein
VWGAIFYGLWMLIRFVMAKIYKIPFAVARGRLLSNRPYSKKRAVQAVARPAVNTSNVSQRSVSSFSEIGILFDIDELGGGYYGYAAYKILFKHLDPKELPGCSLWDGDTQATLAGHARQYCIVIQALDPTRMDYVRNIMAQGNDSGLLAVGNCFLEGNVTSRQPLVLAGQIDAFGNLVVKKGSMISKG